jgi:hypothetical protein
VYTQGAQLISGTVSLNNWPSAIAVSGSVAVYTQGAQLVSGTVSLNNWPTVVAVSGSQLTGSTFSGFPEVVGGYFQSAFGSQVKALQTDISGALYVTSTGSLPVNLGSWFSSVAPTVGQKAMSGSIPVVLPSNQIVAVSSSCSSASVTTVAASVASVQLLASNAARCGALFVNDSAQIAYLKFGTGASNGSYSVRMTSLAYYELPFGYTGVIHASWASASGTMQITELFQ